jgi:hemerythrin-like domain-containing protein
MNPSLPGHHAPAVGFEVPLEMLAACHGRVQHQCETLVRLSAHLQTHGADRAAQEAASAVMRYFDTAARHHHLDEEQDLFPALLDAMAGSDAVCLRELTASLCSDHRRLERHWEHLRQGLLQVAAGRASALADADVPGFVESYEKHIAREESELLPMAARLLSDSELDRIGLAMRTRRTG